MPTVTKGASSRGGLRLTSLMTRPSALFPRSGAGRPSRALCCTATNAKVRRRGFAYLQGERSRAMSFIERFAALLGSPRRDPEIARAIAELSAYSDRELDELGIARGGTIGRAHVELQSLMRISYAVFCLKNKNNKTT